MAFMERKYWVLKPALFLRSSPCQKKDNVAAVQFKLKTKTKHLQLSLTGPGLSKWLNYMTSRGHFQPKLFWILWFSEVFMFVCFRFLLFFFVFIRVISYSNNLPREELKHQCPDAFISRWYPFLERKYL